MLSSQSEDVNTKASALDILLSISADCLTAQSISVSLASAEVKEDAVGPELLRCQFRKLLDKLSEHSIEAQNIVPNIPQSSVGTISLVPPTGSAQMINETYNVPDCSTNSGDHYSRSVWSQSVTQDKVLQACEHVQGHEPQRVQRAMPTLPALPSSMMFSAPPLTPQVLPSCHAYSCTPCPVIKS
jgi:hypothetical protein